MFNHDQSTGGDAVLTDDASADDARPEIPAAKPRRPAGTSARDADAVSGVERKRARTGITRAAVNFALDFLMLLGLCFLVGGNVVVQFIFPPPSKAAGWMLWGRDYDAWSRANFAVLGVMTVLILVHLILHWTWACGFVASRLGKWTGRRIHVDEAVNTIYGVGTLVAFLAAVCLMVGAAQFAIRPPPGG